MRISVSKDNTNFIPKRIESLHSLASIIQRYNYSLGTFKGGYRNIKNFLGAELVGLDFDGGLTLDEAKKLFTEYAHIIAPTRNHRKEKNGLMCDRFRVILKLETEITDARVFKHTVKDLLNKFPQADSACSDASRMFYPGQKFASIRTTGKEITPLEPHLEAVSKDKVVGIKGKLSHTTLDFITHGKPHGQWNPALFKAATDFHEQGYSIHECVDQLKKPTGYLDENDMKTINSAFERDPLYPARIKETVFNIQTIKQIKESKEQIEWIVEGLLTRGGLSILAGSPKCGKSTIIRQLSRSIVRGEPFLERTVKKGRILYLALEEQASLLKEQYEKLDISDEDPFFVHVGPVNGANVAEDLQTVINQHQVDMVVIDTFLLLAQFQNLNDYNDVYKAVSIYRNIARQTNAHIVCLHHQNKGENRGANSILGSTAIQGAVDCAIVMNHVNGAQGLRRLSSWQRGGKPFTDFYIKYDEEREIYEPTVYDGF